MHNPEEIFNTIKLLMQELFEVEPSHVSRLSTLEELDVDSIDAVDMLVKIHEMTGKRIKPEDFKSVVNIGDIVDALDNIINKS
ncbi:MAG: acyl carrier protein [Methylococcales bacterium]